MIIIINIGITIIVVVITIIAESQAARASCHASFAAVRSALSH